MNCTPKDLLTVVKLAHHRLKHHPNYDVCLLLKYVEDALEEDFNSETPEPTGVRRLDLLLLESTFHELQPKLVQALFESTQQISARLAYREEARVHWQKKTGLCLV